MKKLFGFLIALIIFFPAFSIVSKAQTPENSSLTADMFLIPNNDYGDLTMAFKNLGEIENNLTPLGFSKIFVPGEGEVYAGMNDEGDEEYDTANNYRYVGNNINIDIVTKDDKSPAEILIIFPDQQSLKSFIASTKKLGYKKPEWSDSEDSLIFEPWGPEIIKDGNKVRIIYVS